MSSAAFILVVLVRIISFSYLHLSNNVF